jgi:hypothetical protein
MYVETCCKKWANNIHNKWKIKLTSLNLATSQKSVNGFDKSRHTWKGKCCLNHMKVGSAYKFDNNHIAILQENKNKCKKWKFWEVREEKKKICLQEHS